MREDLFKTEMDRVWKEHRGQLKAMHNSAHAQTSAVHERIFALQHTISLATGERVDYKWGPAEYDLPNLTMRVEYQLSCEATGQNLEFTIAYRFDQTEAFGTTIDPDNVDRLLVYVTQAIWEAFQPPSFRKVPIYAPISN